MGDGAGPPTRPASCVQSGALLLVCSHFVLRVNFTWLVQEPNPLAAHLSLQPGCRCQLSLTTVPRVLPSVRL